MISILSPDFIFGDDRGKLVQLVHKGYNQVNVITSNKGFIRGGHFHKINTEAFYVVSGCFELITIDSTTARTYLFKHGDMFSIPPMIGHSFKFMEDTVLVSMYDNGVELNNGQKDIYLND